MAVRGCGHENGDDGVTIYIYSGFHVRACYSQHHVYDIIQVRYMGDWSSVLFETVYIRSLDVVYKCRIQVYDIDMVETMDDSK